jgi:hypothetical protein
MHSEDPDPCPTSLVIRTRWRRREEDVHQWWRQWRMLGSRVDAPQKPNCRSPVQGLERQGLRRHLPSRCSVRAESRDGNTHSCGWTMILRWFCSCVPSDRGSPLLNLSRKEAEGEGSRRVTPRDGQLKEKGLACGWRRDGQLKGLIRSWNSRD